MTRRFRDVIRQATEQSGQLVYTTSNSRKKGASRLAPSYNPDSKPTTPTSTTPQLSQSLFMISIDQLRFRYPNSDFELAIDSLKIQTGEKVAIVGPSGSGKTTLLNLIAGIASPDSGSILIDSNELDLARVKEAGKNEIKETKVGGATTSNATDESGKPPLDIGQLSDAQRRNFRISNIGLVFQQFELVEYLSARDNILAPFWINSTLKLTPAIRTQAEQLADSMGLADKLNRHPAKLSQGEQQRVAICRALLTQPSLILADEPTGNLDPDNKRIILDILFESLADRTLIVVTHDLGILSGFDRTIDFEQFRVAKKDLTSEAASLDNSTKPTSSAASEVNE